jgi:hypothetical protein
MNLQLMNLQLMNLPPMKLINQDPLKNLLALLSQKLLFRLEDPLRVQRVFIDVRIHSGDMDTS